MFGGTGQLDEWDEEFRAYLVGTSRKHLLVDWTTMKYPQDVWGDYVLDNVRQTGIFPRFNPRSEVRWFKKDEPFMPY